MLWTLQWYIFRELGKAFLLTAVGITAVLSMGGGVFNMAQVQSVGPGQLLRIMAVVTPVCLTLALPIAALFSAAVTYGQLSADNEFVACRASGINIQVLFLPTVLISLFSAMVSFASINYLIPGRIRNLDKLIKDDISQFVLRQLRAPRRLRLPGDKVHIYAEDAFAIQGEDLPKNSAALRLRGVAFVERSKDGWSQYGTAKTVRIAFDKINTSPEFNVDFFEASAFDLKANRYFRSDHQSIGPVAVPRRFPLKIKWLTLSELFSYRNIPEELPEMADQIASLRALLACEMFYRELEADFAQTDETGQPDTELTFGDDLVHFRITADAMTPDLHDRKPVFEGITVVSTSRDLTKTAKAGGGTISVNLETLTARIELFGGVTITDSDNPANPIKRSRDDSFAAVALPEGVTEQIEAISHRQLLDPAYAISAGQGVAKPRGKAIEEREALGRQINAVIHSRLALSVSVFVLVILGAALGIIFRGAHLMTAFGISFLPSILVIVAIITGRQLAQNPGSIGVGLVTIWAGIAVVGLVDAWILTRVLKR